MDSPILRRSELSILEEIFKGLTSIVAADRGVAAQRLRRFATVEVRRALDEADAQGVTHRATEVECSIEIMQRISDLVDSTEQHHKLGAVAAIESLIDVEQEMHPQMGTRFANYVNSFIRRSDSGPEHQEIVVAAVAALGKLVKADMGIPADMVEDAISNALDWIRKDAEKIEELKRRRFAAVHVLRQLAVDSPTHFYVQVIRDVDIKDSFLEVMWGVLCDKSEIIRRTTASALGACLQMVAQREGDHCRELYKGVYNQALNHLASHSDAEVHGALLAMYQLVVIPHAMDEYVSDHLEPLARFFARIKDHRDICVRQQFLQLLPALHKSPAIDAVTKIDGTLIYLMELLRKGEFRGAAFIALGELAAARPEIKEYEGWKVDQIFLYARDSLPSAAVRKSKQQPCVEEALHCVRILVETHGADLTQHIQDLLPSMFEAEIGLCVPLHKALTAIMDHVESASVQQTVRNRLLDMVSKELTGQGIKAAIGARLQIEHAISSPSVGTRAPPVEGHSRTQLLELAFEILSTFSFGELLSTPFIDFAVVKYLTEEEPSIRRAAALCCCNALTRIQRRNDAASAQLRNNILERCLVLATTDLDAELRRSVLSTMANSSDFDDFLAVGKNLRLVFIPMHDEELSVRKIAMQLLGRLGRLNPSSAMPSFRKMLVQLLTQLEYNNEQTKKEESVELLTTLIRSSHELVQPYATPIAQSLIAKLEGKTVRARVAARMLEALGELVQMGAEHMQDHLDALLQIIIDSLQDQSSALKREIALRALRQLVSGTGTAIQPYLDHPALMGLLLKVIKQEVAPHVRAEAVRALGTLGAIDPHVLSMGTREFESQNFSASDALIPGIGEAAGDSVTAETVGSLVRILKNETLKAHHSQTVSVLMFIMKGIEYNARLPFLPLLLPPFLRTIRTCDRNHRAHLLDKLKELVELVKGSIVSMAEAPEETDFLAEIIDLVEDSWSEIALLKHVLDLIQKLSEYMPMEFKPHMPSLLPKMIASLQREWRTVLNGDESDSQASQDAGRAAEHCEQILSSFETFGSMLADYMYLALPQMVSIVVQPGPHGLDTKRIAAGTIGTLCEHVNMTEYSSRIVLPLARALLERTSEATDAQQLKITIINTLSTLITSIGYEYAIFIPMIENVMAELRSAKVTALLKSLKTYDTFVSKLLTAEYIHNPQHRESVRMTPLGRSMRAPPLVEEGEKLPVDHSKLEQAWDTRQRATKEDWTDWFRKFSIDLIRQSPSQALRQTDVLVPAYPQLAMELFKSAFVSCWSELYDSQQNELVRNLEKAIVSVSTPPHVLQSLLNLAEHMEHDERPLPMDIQMLADISQKSQAFAKALHYWELHFDIDPESAIEPLISINTELQQPEAAEGMLRILQASSSSSVGVDLARDAEIYTKLHNWPSALQAYRRLEDEGVSNLDNDLKQWRCLAELGEWEQLSAKVADRTGSSEVPAPPGAPAGSRVRFKTVAYDKRTAAYGAKAAWNLGNWDRLRTYVDIMGDEVTEDGGFLRAVLALHKKDHQEAKRYIDTTRTLIEQRLTEVVSDSYVRAYDVVFRVQELSELEEVIAYRECSSDQSGTDRQLALRRMWDQRLRSCQPRVEFWQRSLAIRALVIKMTDDIEMRLKFAALCRKNGRLNAAQACLAGLLERPPEELSLDTLAPGTCVANSEVVFNYLKLSWSMAESNDDDVDMRDRTLHTLHAYIERWVELRPAHAGADGTGSRDYSFDHFLASCYRQAGLWQAACDTDGTMDMQILKSYKKATELHSGWFKAWSSWALMNYEVATRREDSSDGEVSNDPEVITYMARALEGFIQSIRCVEHNAAHNTLQDVLRVLTVWFRYGEQQDVSNVVQKRGQGPFADVDLDTWLQVIPQIVARIDIPTEKVRQQICDLLTRIGREHPQSLLFSLLVSEKSDVPARTKAARKIMSEMKSKPLLNLITDARLVSRELDRIAVLWNEEWHAGLEEACKAYFTHKDDAGMIAQLEKLQESLEKGAETMRETSFQQQFGSQLHEAWEWIKRYKRSRSKDDLNRAWNIYFTEFQLIAKTLDSEKLELQYVSPKLLEATDLQLAVPGTYAPGREIVRIEKFYPMMNVLPSKQRPRKLQMRGSDGRDYEFLLKGKEDIRLDERVMQLFGLINTMLSTDSVTSRRDLAITRYNVVPLSPTSGLIGWVRHTDTLNVLIKGYREARNIRHHVEQGLMLQCAPRADISSYDKLSTLQKVEAFEWALKNTKGQDLKQVLWLKSRNSEVWLERRNMFTRSLATMSMVGYILGLGDRHPSNLMMHRHSGKIVHIDFGDCFDICRQRDKYPEHIPFRLTRMLVKAMEVSGIEGNFKIICEEVLGLMRREKDSVLAMLEAFVHDPLINWRLVHHPADTTTASSSGAGSGAASAVAPTKASAAAAAATGSVLDAPMLAQVLTEQGHEAAVIQQAAAVIGQAGSRGRGGADGGLVPAGTPSVAMQGSLRAASLAGASARPLSRAGSLGQQQHQGSESAIGDADISVNKTAREILGRISAKLTGTEGGSGIGLEEGVPPGQAAAAAADDDGSLTSSGGGGALANVTPLTVPQQVQRCETPLCPPPARLPGRCVLVV
jgi:FKBP12-rapamycin complex-associated protein